MGLIFVDCEAFGGCPGLGRLTEFGAVAYPSKVTFHGRILDTKPSEENAAVPTTVELTDREYYALAKPVFAAFEQWLKMNSKGRPIFVSDNPAFDFQWINDGFLRTLGANPFGHSGRRISDFWAGMNRDFYDTQRWKQYRITPHDHNPVNDAIGNVEAFEKLMSMAKAAVVYASTGEVT